MTAADKLRALAQAATPGPWLPDHESDPLSVYVPDRPSPRDPDQLPLTHADADYIAAMSPDVALALADLLDAAARMRDADIIVAPADWPISQAFAAAVAHVEEVLDE